ncbi:MAG: zf-HC2 domain-containing protein [Planctomycetota bacterium]
MPSKDLLLRCDHLYAALDRYLDREVSLWERIFVSGHLMMCPPCRAYLKQYRQVREITDHPAPSDLPEDFEQVMKRVVGSWREDPEDATR